MAIGPIKIVLPQNKTPSFDMTGFVNAGMYQQMYIAETDELRDFPREDGDTLYDTVTEEA